MRSSTGNLLLGRFLRVDALAAGPALCARGLEMFDEARQRVGTTIEDEIVAHLAHLGFDLEVRGDLFGMDERAVEPGLDAVVEEDRVEHRARVGARPKETFEMPSDVNDPGSSRLIARMPSIVSTAESRTRDRRSTR